MSPAFTKEGSVCHEEPQHVLAVGHADRAVLAAGAAGRGGAGGERGNVQDFLVSDDVVVEWNAIAVATIVGQSPLASTRIMATVQLAVFEAVNSISGRYEPYRAAIPAPANASAEAAAIAAAHGVLKAFFPAAGAVLDGQRDASLALVPGGQIKIDGIAVGEAAAAAMVAERTGDGSAPPQFFPPPSTDPYEWQTTPSCPPAGGAFLHWRHVMPFGVLSASQFRADPPPALDSGKYARDLNELRALGDVNSPERTQNQADVAHQGSMVAQWNLVNHLRPR